MNSSAFKIFAILMMATRLFGCAGSSTETVEPDAATSTASPVPSPTHFKYTPGIYSGSDPEIIFWLSEDGQLSFKRFLAPVTFEEGSTGPCEILENNERNNYPNDGFTSSLENDGSFVAENEVAGTIVKGNISGDTASGTFSVDNCGPFYDFATPHPVNGSWTANWFATPTPEPTPLPPVNGHYAGENVSFDIADAEGGDKQVRNFRLQVNDGMKTCTFSQDGQWLLDTRGSIAAYFNYAVVSFHVYDKDASGGFSQTECGGGTWRAIWVGP